MHPLSRDAPVSPFGTWVRVVCVPKILPPLSEIFDQKQMKRAGPLWSHCHVSPRPCAAFSFCVEHSPRRSNAHPKCDSFFVRSHSCIRALARLTNCKQGPQGRSSGSPPIHHVVPLAVAVQKGGEGRLASCSERGVPGLSFACFHLEAHQTKTRAPEPPAGRFPKFLLPRAAGRTQKLK